jgi:glycerophosphoryl diester phosphodiesterase
MDIIAHRGASGQAPENTMPAFLLAWQLGADGIELDVRLSRDRRVIVHHDADTRRSARCDLKIADTDSAVLCELDVGYWRGEAFRGTRIPLLDEVLAEVPGGKRVLIEIKCGPEIIPALQQTLAETNGSDIRIGPISFHLDTLIACREAFPLLPCYPVFSFQSDENNGAVAKPQDWIGVAQQHGFPGLDPDHRDITADYVAAIHAAGLELVTWTVNDTQRLRELHSMGVDTITSDWPERMLEALKELA